MDLVVGRVVKAHGVTGEVVVEVRTDDPGERFRAGARLRGVAKGRPERPVVVESVREHGGRLLVRVAGVGDRDTADALRGTLLLVAAADLPPIEDPDEFYDHQLIGLTVRDAAGAEVGVVADVLHTAGGELLVLRTATAAGPGEVLVPFVSAIVTAVSLAEGVLRIDPPPGLLELQ